MKKFNDQEIARRDKLKELQNKNQDPFSINSFKRNYNSLSFKDKFGSFSKEDLHTNKTQIKMSGRIVSQSLTFAKIQDFFGKTQIYINKKTHLECFEILKNDIHIGDIVGVEGTPMKTNTGELTINTHKIIILSKALKPLPEKWNGLHDEEIRSRNRYLDLITNEKSMKTFILRSVIIKEIRNYMDSLNYFEVETPILQPILGGANARPFKTFHNTLKREYYLRIATELPLKKLIVGGFEKVYEIGRIFRNEGMDATHNPEFTSIEAYEAYFDMYDIMQVVENLFKHIAKKLGIDEVIFLTHKININNEFKKIHILDLIKETTNIDFRIITSHKEAIKLCKEKKIHLLPHQFTWGHIVNVFFETYCEKALIEPTFVYGHPVEISPLAKRNIEDSRLTERFELFIGGKEFGNAFSELNDPIEQEKRFIEQIKEKNQGNLEANEIDEDYINALEYGLPPTGGFGLGIDRIVMLFTNQESIRNVLLFPHLRDEK